MAEMTETRCIEPKTRTRVEMGGGVFNHALKKIPRQNHSASNTTRSSL